MRKRIIIGIALMVGIVIVIAVLVGGHNSIISLMEKNQTGPSVPVPETHPDQTLGGLSHNLVLEKSLSDEVKNIMVYKAAPSQVTRQDIISLGQKFNITEPNEIKEAKEGFSIAADDGSAYVILMNSGWIEYSNSNRDTINPLDVPGNLPSDDEAVMIATTFLNDRDLLPQGATVIRTTHGKILGTAKDGADIVFWEDINVWYGRKLSGYPVEGTQLMLAIGARGDPIEFIKNWRNYVPYKEFPVKSPEQAFEELKVKGVAVSVMDKPDTISINDMYLAYKTKPAAESEEYLEPVWVFKGNVMVDGKPVDSVVQYIPALVESPNKLVSTLSVTTSPTTQPTALITGNESVVPTSTTSIIAATPIATISLNETVVSLVPTDTISVTPTVSLAIPQNTTSGNVTAG